MFAVPSINLRLSFSLPSLPKLQIRRRLQRALIRVILAALFIARAEIRAINVQGMLLSWFRFCPEFRDQANARKTDWNAPHQEEGCGGRPFTGTRAF